MLHRDRWTTVQGPTLSTKAVVGRVTDERPGRPLEDEVAILFDLPSSSKQVTRRVAFIIALYAERTFLLGITRLLRLDG